jgi:A/G-specific adenine glycosylase
MEIQEFRDVIWQFGRTHRRQMPWRTRPEPYFVLVSEIMLQQTQVERVIPKFELFISRYPSFKSLAHAPLSDVLTLWSGLGYNRRAKFLLEAAQKVVTDYKGVLPQTKAELMTLPGVGENTAGAILAYAFNFPSIFVETNIRSVFFQHFFVAQDQVSDKELYEKVAQTLDHEHPREWYWALMDYGTYLKKNGAARLHQSRHYKKQSPLKGSPREMRGRIIKTLSQQSLSEADLKRTVAADERFSPALQALLRERLIKRTRGKICLA